MGAGPTSYKAPTSTNAPTSTTSTSTKAPTSPKGRAPRTRPADFEFLGVNVKGGFANPVRCPWLGYNYVCRRSRKYLEWLKTWAATTSNSSLVPETRALPPGISLWMGQSHLFQVASTFMCQRHSELQELEVLECIPPKNSATRKKCKTKVQAFKSLASADHACEADLKFQCRMVAVGPFSRCGTRAYPNVVGQGGTHQLNADRFPESYPTPEDKQCGVRSIPTPACSYSISRFTFASGHVAIMISNHIIQFYNNSLEKIANFLALDMGQVKTIVYSQPWTLRQARNRFREACRKYSYTLRSNASTFWVDAFRSDIIEFALGAGFSGILLFVDMFTRKRRGTEKLVEMSQRSGIQTHHLQPAATVKSIFRGSWCCSDPARGGSCANETGHQCIPSIPDFVAWDVARLLT